MTIWQKRQSWRSGKFVPSTLLLGLLLLLSVPIRMHAQAPAGTQASATLTWTASSGATSYNAYRSAAATGPFSVLNSAAITSTSYADLSVTVGNTYYYCVTALVTLSTGPFESACSTVVSGTIPKAPVIAPTNVSVAVSP